MDASCINFQGSKRRDGYFNGKIQWQVVDIDTGEVWRSPIYSQGTINIGEFCAIVSGLRILHQCGDHTTPVYSDSRIALNWVESGYTNTALPVNDLTAATHEVLRADFVWLMEHKPKNPLFWWRGYAWGENPADFGRKTRPVYA